MRNNWLLSGLMAGCLALTAAGAPAESVTPSPHSLVEPGMAMPTPAPTPYYAHVKGVETDMSIVPDAQFSAWPHISMQETQRLMKMKHVVIADARSKVEWDQGHIPGAVPAPLGEFDAYYKKNEKLYKSAKYIIVYCHGVGCHLSDMAAKHFAEKGYHNVVNFYAGWPAWSEAHMPSQNSAGVITTPTPVPSASPVPKP